MEKSKIYSLIIIAYVCICVIIYGIILLEGMWIDNDISKIYVSEIKFIAEKKISEVVNNSLKQANEIEKARAISEWTTKFMSPNESFHVQDRFSNLINPDDKHYWKTTKGRWFIRRGRYSEDVMIIAHCECGKCGEAATVWNFTANLAGIITREVKDPSGFHAWVEVSHGTEWYYVDPTVYPQNNVIKWFNSTINRSQSPLIQKVARVVTSDGQDITDHYPPYGRLIINNVGNYNTVFARWDDGDGKKFDESYDINMKPAIEINLSPKNYTIYTYAIGQWILSKKREVTIEEGKTIEIDLFEKFEILNFQSNNTIYQKIDDVSIASLPSILSSLF